MHKIPMIPFILILFCFMVKLKKKETVDIMWHEYIWEILNIVNNVLLMCIGIPFTLQLLYMLLFWVKKTKFPKSEKKANVCYIIPAHNEEDVIYSTVSSLIEKQKYPKDKLSVYVVCHNCDDKTAELAKKAGANILIYNDDNPKHKMVAYPLNYAFDQLRKLKKYDFYLRLDADNHVNDEFTSLMNDAFQSGIEFARGYESALNMTQNSFTKACGLYYTFDSRFSSRVRERFNIAAHINGPGMMISSKLLEEMNGYNCFSIAEDAEFNFNVMLKGKKGHFVEDAVVYEDLPSTFADTYKRNKRIAAGSRTMFAHQLGKMFFKFFTTFRFSYLEMVLTYFFNIICVLLCTWIPLYYIYDFIYLMVVKTGNLPLALHDAAFYNNTLITTLIVAALAIGILFFVCGLLQGFILILLDYKKMGAKKRRELFSGALLFPFFTVIYCITICFGYFSKATWGKVSRNINKQKITSDIQDKESD